MPRESLKVNGRWKSEGIEAYLQAPITLRVKVTRGQYKENKFSQQVHCTGQGDEFFVCLDDGSDGLEAMALDLCGLIQTLPPD